MANNYGESGLDWVLGMYDQAFATSFLSNLRYKYLDVNNNATYIPIPRVFSSPERAYTDMATVIQKSTGKSVAITNVPRPFFSIIRNVMKFDDSRYVFPGQYIAFQDNTSGEYRTDSTFYNALKTNSNLWPNTNYIYQEFPTPVDIKYTVELWGKNIRHLDDISVGVMRLFRNKFFMVQVPFDAPVNKQQVAMFFDGETDNSNIEPGFTENRTERRTYEFTIKGWIFNTPSIIRPVLTMDIGIYDYSEVLNTYELAATLNLPTS